MLQERGEVSFVPEHLNIRKPLIRTSPNIGDLQQVKQENMALIQQIKSAK